MKKDKEPKEILDVVLTLYNPLFKIKDHPEHGRSLKPFVLLFDEYYTDIYRISEAENWMTNAKKIIFEMTAFFLEKSVV